MSSRPTDERTLRVAAAAADSGADWALLVSPDDVCYATGYEQPIETGPSPFQGGPPLALVGRDGTSGLVVTNIEVDLARSSRADVVRGYEGFSSERQPPLAANYLDALRALVRELGAGGTVALDAATVPLLLAEELRSRFDSTVGLEPGLARSRAVKTEVELDQLRRCAEIVSIGQRAALDATRAGCSELEAFADIRCAMERAHGARLALTGDYISGVERTAACEGWPNDREMRSRDPVICDLSPRVHGYWGDSCNTLFVGEPPPDFLELYRCAQRAIHQAVESIRPGVTAATVAREVQHVIDQSGYDNPLHVGHGIGTSFHEFPKIVRGESALLEPGMVLMMEPGAYRVGVGGARLESMFEVTATGNSILTDFDFDLGN